MTELNPNPKRVPGTTNRSYEYGYCGPAAIAIGLQELRAADLRDEVPGTITFLVAAHHATSDHVAATVTIGVGMMDATWRYCGERGEPEGAGSHQLHPYFDDVIGASAALAYNLALRCASAEATARVLKPTAQYLIFREVR